MRQPELPVGSPPAVGFGTNFDIFSGNEDLIIYPSYAQGKLLHFIMIILSYVRIQNSGIKHISSQAIYNSTVCILNFR